MRVAHLDHRRELRRVEDELGHADPGVHRHGDRLRLDVEGPLRPEGLQDVLAQAAGRSVAGTPPRIGGSDWPIWGMVAAASRIFSQSIDSTVNSAGPRGSGGRSSASKVGWSSAAEHPRRGDGARSGRRSDGLVLEPRAVVDPLDAVQAELLGLRRQWDRLDVEEPQADRLERPLPAPAWISSCGSGGRRHWERPRRSPASRVQCRSRGPH